MSAKTRNSGLGRGLDALFSQGETVLTETGTKVTEDGEYILQLPIGDIDVNKDQPRKAFDDEGIAGLAASIKANGLLQPIAVSKSGDRFIIIAGERRFRAVRSLGWDTIPAIVKNFSRQQSMELALIENIQREDLNPMDEAAAISSLLEEFGLTQQELSDRIGKSRSAVANTVRLLQLQPDAAQFVRNGVLSAGHARALLALTNADDQLPAAREMVFNKLNVRQAEALIGKYNNRRRDLKKDERVRYPELREYEQAVRENLGTRVDILGTPKKGKLSIEYYSQDQLQGLLDLLSATNGII